MLEKIKDSFNKVRRFFIKRISNDIGIDLGTANALVYVSGKGIVINEPSVVAINEKTGRVVAVGSEAKNMLGRTPMHIKAERPVVDGVISNFEVAGEMIAFLINKAERDFAKKIGILGPRVLVGVPSGITNVETRAVRDAAYDAGAREVFIIEEPMAAAIGENLPVKEAKGTIIIDIGGGTTDVAVISLGGIVASKNMKIAGDHFNQNIIEYVKERYKIIIGEKTAEEAKIKICSVLEIKKKEKDISFKIRGRDSVNGIPKEVEIYSSDIQKAMKDSIDLLIEGVKEVVEKTPPEIISDVLESGIFITGGGSLICGLDKLIKKNLNTKVHIVEDPLTAVVRGTGIALEDLDYYKESFVDEEKELSLSI